MKINKQYLLWLSAACFFITIIYFVITSIHTKSGLPSEFKDFNKKARARREIIASNLEPTIQIIDTKQKEYTIYELMKFLNVPGVSIAVFKEGHVDYQASYGYADQDNKRSLTINTLLQAASISKPIAAVTAIASGYDLNADIRPKLQLLGLDDLYANYALSEITLRQILSHTAGFNVHGFDGYTDDKLPSINQILNGTKPANNAAIRVVNKPGDKFSYSGGGYTVMELLLQQYKGQLFAEQVQQEVFNKLKMTHSTYDVSKLINNVSYAHNALGKKIKNNYNRYPEKAAAGLWTTPLDLSIIALDILAGLNKNSSRVLAKNQITDLLTNQTYENSTSGYALGFRVDISDKGIKTFGHGGVNNGFRSNLLVDVSTGQGFVIMTNSDNGDLLANIIGNTIAKVYKFSSYEPPVRISAQTNNVDPVYLREYKVSYSEDSLKLFIDNNQLKIKLPMRDGATYVLNLYQTSDKTYVNDWFDMIKITLDKTAGDAPIIKVFDEVAVVK